MRERVSEGDEADAYSYQVCISIGACSERDREWVIKRAKSVYINTCIHTHIRTYMHMQRCLRTFRSDSGCVLIHTYIHTYIHHTHIHIYFHTYIHICTHTTHTYIYVHAYTQVALKFHGKLQYISFP